MLPFKNNRFVHALVFLMFFSAVIHMVVLALHFIMTKDYTPFNFFRIIGLDLFYPNFVSSSGLLSVITIISIYVFSYKYLTKKNR